MFIKKDSKVPEIRVIPMQRAEFKNRPAELVQQDYFIEDLKKRTECKYTYNSRGINSKHGALLLFQYRNKIIASAQFDKDENEALWLEKSTISVFEPISANELGLLRFSNTKKYIKIDLQNLLELLEKKLKIYEMPYQEKVNAVDIDNKNFKDVPKSKLAPISAEQKRWSRNPSEGKKALHKANFKCEYDNSHNFFVSGSTGHNYVECHHLIPMKFQDDFESSIDIFTNIISLCPVCHRKLHFANFEDKKDMLLDLFSKRKARLAKVEIKVMTEKLMEYYQ